MRYMSQGIFFLYFSYFSDIFYTRYFHLLCISRYVFHFFYYVYSDTYGQFPYLILSPHTDFTFLLFSFPLFSDLTLGDKTNEVVTIGAYRPGQQKSHQQRSIDEEAYAHESLEALRSRRLPLPHGHWPRPSPPHWTNRVRILLKPLPHHWEAFLNQLQPTISPYG